MKKLDQAATAASSSNRMTVRIRPRYLGLALTAAALLPSPKPGVAADRRAVASCASGLPAVGRGTTLRSRLTPRMPGAVTKAPTGLPDLFIAGFGAADDFCRNGTVSRVPGPAAGRAMLGLGTVGRNPGAAPTGGILLAGAATALVVPAVAAAMAAVRRLAKAATISAAGAAGISSSFPGVAGSGATSIAMGASGTDAVTLASPGFWVAGLISPGLGSAPFGWGSDWAGRAISRGQDAATGADLACGSVTRADAGCCGAAGGAVLAGGGVGSGAGSAASGRDAGRESETAGLENSASALTAA